MIYSLKEMQERYERTRQLLKKRRLDALVITNEENFIYFAGTSGSLAFHHSNTRPSAIVASLWSDPVCVVSSSVPDSVSSNFITEVRTYPGVRGLPPDMLVKAVRDSGLKFRRIGIEGGLEQRLGLPYSDFERFRKKMEGTMDIKFVDSADTIWQLRMVKSEEEISYMREAAKITGRARQKCFEKITPEMTDREVARIFSALMFEEGADRVAFVLVDTRPPYSHTMMFYDRENGRGILNRGDLLALDGGAYSRAYCVDYPRLATIGAASGEQIESARKIRNVNRKMADAIRPGMKCSDLYKKALKLLKEVGVDAVESRRMGHGQGMLLTEPPSIAAFDDTVLEPGMTLSTEPSFSSKDGGVYCLEDTHVVTNEGHEKITLEPDDLVEIKS